MKVQNDCKVSVSYELMVNGRLEDQADASAPLEFIFGQGQLLPAFEDALEGLEAGQEFKMTLSPEEGYGIYNEKNKVKLPLHIFEFDGEVAYDILKVGNTIPMQMQGGGTMMGRVLAVDEDHTLMDFNHPLAGETLHFTGRVEKVEQATEEELAQLEAEYSCGSGCGSSCGDGGHDCGCGCC